MLLYFCHVQTSVCQHVVATEKPVVFEGLHNHPAPAANEDMVAASKVDDDLRQFLEEMSAHTTSGGSSRSGNTPLSKQDLELKMTIVYDFMQEVLAHPEVGLASCTLQTSFG